MVAERRASREALDGVAGIEDVLTGDDREVLGDFCLSCGGREGERQGGDAAGGALADEGPGVADDLAVRRVLFAVERIVVASEGQAEEVAA